MLRFLLGPPRRRHWIFGWPLWLLMVLNFPAMALWVFWYLPNHRPDSADIVQGFVIPCENSGHVFYASFLDVLVLGGLIGLQILMMFFANTNPGDSD
jgi:hypothetical protein